MKTARSIFVFPALLLLGLVLCTPQASAQKSKKPATGAPPAAAAATPASAAAASSSRPAAATSGATAAPAPFTGSVNIILKDGKTVSTAALRRSGDNVMATVQIGPGSGEVGYPVATIARIDFPEPPQLKIAADMITRGKSADAITQIDQIVSYYAPFKDVPGNWWSQAVLLKINALVSAGRERDAEGLINDMAKSSGDPEAARAARVQMAANWTRKGEHERAMPVYDEVIKESKNPDTLAQAWLNKGHALLASQQFDPAALAYLHVPVFYPEQKLLMPQALLGAGRALAALNDVQNARATFGDLIAGFPASPEAAAAKSELDKLESSGNAGAGQNPG